MWTTSFDCLISRQRKGIFDMRDADIMTVYQNSDYVKAI